MKLNPRDGRYTPLPWRACCYEFYNPWSGFNPCTLAQGWDWLLSMVRTRFPNPPSQLALYNRENNKTLAYWMGTSSGMAAALPF